MNRQQGMDWPRVIADAQSDRGRNSIPISAAIANILLPISRDLFYTQRQSQGVSMCPCLKAIVQTCTNAFAPGAALLEPPPSASSLAYSRGTRRCLRSPGIVMWITRTGKRCKAFARKPSIGIMSSETASAARTDTAAAGDCGNPASIPQCRGKAEGASQSPAILCRCRSERNHTDLDFVRLLPIARRSCQNQLRNRGTQRMVKKNGVRSSFGPFQERDK
jgi:hypothetical protein